MIRLPDVKNLPRDPDVLLEVIRGMCEENDGQRVNIAALQTENADQQKNIIDLTGLIDQYKKENSWLREKGLPDGEFLAQRRAQAEPVLAEMKTWLADNLPKVAPQTLLYEAMRYTRNEWDRLNRYLDHPELTPDNNIAENFIRYFVIGRKNWLFANTVLGAHASATLYSFIVSAGANGLEPYAYMKHVLTVLPAIPEEKLAELLPHRIDPTVLQNDATGRN